MKRKKKARRLDNSSANAKISQRLSDFAGDFIRMGDTLEQRQSHLNAACSAWNIACNHPAVREKNLAQYMREYQRFNPDADAEQLADVRSDMEKLIEVKLEMFPSDLRQIVGARIISVAEGKDRIEAAAVTVR